MRERGARMNEFGVEVAPPPSTPSPRAPVDRVPQAIAVLFALAIYAALAFGAFDASRAVFPGDPTSAESLSARLWSEALFLGALFGIPGTVLAALLAASHLRGEAPFVGGLAGLIQAGLGYATLLALREPSVRASLGFLPALVVFGLGWMWALPARRWTMRREAEDRRAMEDRGTDREREPGRWQVPRSPGQWGAVALTLLFAIGTWIAASHLANRVASASTPAGDVPPEEVARAMWPIYVQGGAVLAFPGLLVAACLLAPRRWGFAPFAGAAVALVHFGIGYGLLVASYERPAFDTMVQTFIFLGWLWAFALRWALRGWELRGWRDAGRSLAPEPETDRERGASEEA